VLRSSLPSGMRRRVPASGIPYFYWELPSSGRIEIALGSDYTKALLLRAHYLLNFSPDNADQLSNSSLVLNLYREAVVPIQPVAARVENQRTIGKLLAFFAENGISWNELIQKEHRSNYYVWRGPNSSVRARREWELIGAVQKWISMTYLTGKDE
jgi:hypothetical protein